MRTSPTPGRRSSPTRLAAALALAAVGLFGCGDPDVGVLRIEAEAASPFGPEIRPGGRLGRITVLREGVSDREELLRPVVVTLTHDGSGELIGTTQRTMASAAMAFDGLSYAGCGSFRIRATADDPAIPPAETGSITVRPLLTLVEGVDRVVIPGGGPIGRVVVQLTGAVGELVPLDGVGLRLAASGPIRVTGGTTEVTTVGGIATFDDIEVGGSGLGVLRVTTAGTDCPVDDLEVSAIAVGDVFDGPPIHLPSARVGVPYAETFGAMDERYLHGALPPGLAVSAGQLTGVPTETGAWRVEVFRAVDTEIERVELAIAVFPNHDPELAEPEDPSAPGPHPVGVTAWTLPTVTTSTGALSDVAVRVAYPSDGASGLADGVFGAVVFLPTVADPPATYDLYTELHDHWASHGFVVLSVDSSALAAEPLDAEALEDHRRLALTALDALRAEAASSTSAFFGGVDLDRVFLAGHGRGGGGALLAARDEPGVAGVLTFAPVLAEVLAASGTRAPPDPMPIRPGLVIVAERDRVVPWPNADMAGSLLTGPAAVVTIRDTNHLDALDAASPHVPLTTSGLPRADRRAVERRYTTAFLRRFAYDEIGFEATLFMERGQTSGDTAVVVRARRYTGTAVPVEVVGSVGWSPYEDALLAMGVGLAESRLPFLDGAHGIALAADGQIGASLGRESFDVADRRRVVFDVLRECPPPPADPVVDDDVCPPVELPIAVGLTDLDGVQSYVPARPDAVVGRHWRTVALDLADFAVDPGRLARVVIRRESADPVDERLWIRDLRFE